MSKPANKLPTIQDLSREELLRLIPMIVSPLRVDPGLILRAQIDTASDHYRAASDVWHALMAPAEQASARWEECTSRNAPQKVTDKAWRAWLAANDARDAARQKANRFWRRWGRLTEQYRAFMDGEA